MVEVDVVVVGAGLAGVTAAREVTRAGVSAVVLEARNRLGGRTYRRAFQGTDLQLEFGGTWIGPEANPEFLDLLAEYGLGTDPSPEIVHFVTVLQGVRSRATGLADAERAALEAKLVEIAEASTPAVLDQSVDEVLRKANLSEAAMDWMRAYTRYLSGAEIDEVAMKLYIPDGCRPMDRFQNKIEGGTGAFMRATADAGNFEVRFGATVERIQQDDNAVSVTTHDGSIMTAKYAIVTLPINVWADVEWSPALSSSKQNVAAQGHAGHAVKLWAMVDGAPPYFRAAGTAGPISYWRTETIHEGFSLVAGFGASSSTFDPSDISAVDAALKVYLPAAEVCQVDSHDWGADPYSKGTWFVPKPGLLTDYASMDQQEGRLVFAGGDVGWPREFRNIPGAVLSGRAAGRRVSELMLGKGRS